MYLQNYDQTKSEDKTKYYNFISFFRKTQSENYIQKKETQEISISLLMLAILVGIAKITCVFVSIYLSSCLSRTLSIKPYSTARGADMKLSRSVSA